MMWYMCTRFIIIAECICCISDIV